MGGGLAGVAAATVLAERGVSVTLIERDDHLGGRAGAWTTELATGARLEMERGFHAFFRQYYNLRALLRRVDPDLRRLVPLHDYPIVGPGGAVESFAGLPRRAPLNIIRLVGRTRTLRLLDLLRVNKRAALEMLRFRRDRTYARWDAVSAASYLDALKFPPRARRMLFDVFSHSFFNPEGEMSAAELLMMFHFYFVGNPEGLVFDVLDEPFSSAIWHPFQDYLTRLGVDVRLGRAVTALEPARGGGWGARLAGEGEPDLLEADAVVLAVTVPAVQAIVAESTALEAPTWQSDVAGLALTRPFAVWRLWLDGPIPSGTDPFVGTAGFGLLDNISLYHLFEGESRRWADRTGGSVVELHAYAVPEGLDEAHIRAELSHAFHRLHPAARQLGVVDERFLLRRDCPAFPPGSDARRPGVRTPWSSIVLAGDFVRLDIPTALMERAVTSGFVAANHLLEQWGEEPEVVRHVPLTGLFG